MLRERKKLVRRFIQKFEVEGPPTTTTSEKHTTKPQKYSTKYALDQWLDPQNGYRNKAIADPMWEYK